MKKVSYILLTLLMLAACTSCELETSTNGALDGYWRLQQVDTLQTKGTADLSAQRLFWSVQGKVLMLNDLDYRYPECVMEFEHRDQRLMLHRPLISDRTKGDPVIDDVKILYPYGIRRLDEQFEVERLDGSHMVLRGEQLRLVFTKF